MPPSNASRTAGPARVATPAAQLPDHDALRAFFSGKRRSDRRNARFRVELHANGERLYGRTVDLSEGGVLVRVPDDEARSTMPMPALLETMRLLEEKFQTGVSVGFPTLGVQIPVTPIRLASQPADGDGFLLGFRFDRPLTHTETRKLLPTFSIPRGPLASLAKARTLHALVFVESEAVIGPALAGRVTALQGATLDVRAEASAAAANGDAASELLRDRAARLRVTESGRRLWEGPVRVVYATDASDGLGGVEVRVEAEVDLPPPVAKHFRARA
jgi:hypothetical protein